jgi:energy-coupling factor transporter ATP-binding protein EcfA2
MLRRFEWIRDGGYFCDFRSDTSLPEFGRINVIYGSNGAGKSSLARVLDGLRPDADGHQKTSIVVDDDGSRRSTDGQADPAFSRVLVFIEEYVARTHRFRDGDADMEAVLTLGQRTAEDEERLELLRAERQTLTEERTDLAASRSRIARDLEATYGRVAQAVVDDASRAGPASGTAPAQPRSRHSTGSGGLRLDSHHGHARPACSPRHRRGAAPRQLHPHRAVRADLA